MSEPAPSEAAPAERPIKRIEKQAKRAVSLSRALFAVVLGYRGEALALRAGNLTFITITSLVPMVAVIFSLLHAFNAKRIDPLVLKFFEDILSPGGRAQSEQAIHTFLSAANSRTAGSLSFLVVMVSAGLLLRHLDSALNDIWRVRKKRPILVSLWLYAGVLVIGPLLIALSLLGTEGAKQLITWLDLPFSAQLYVLGAIVSGMTVFTLLFKLAPHAPVRWSSALVGGAAAGVAWELARHLYGTIASWFFSANKIYGSLGIAPLFLTWIYVGWYIVLSGARLAYAVEHANLHHEFEDLLDHPRSHELIAARIAEEVARAALDGTRPPTTFQLAAQLRMPEQRLRDIVYALEAGGLVRLERGRLIPTRDVATLTLADISAAVGGTARLRQRERSKDSGHFAAVARLFSSADETTIQKLRGISWADLAHDQPAEEEKP